MRVLFTLLFLVSSFAMGCSHYGNKHHKHGGKYWKMMDTDKDGSVSKAEFDTAQGERFKVMDGNTDGKISKDEKKAYFSKGKKDKGCDSEKGDKEEAKKDEKKAS